MEILSSILFIFGVYWLGGLLAKGLILLVEGLASIPVRFVIARKPWTKGRERYAAVGRKYIEEMVAKHSSIMDLKYIDSLTQNDYIKYAKQSK